MNEYVIHAKVKNNLILSRILAVADTVGAFCRQHNLSASLVGDLVNMKTPALGQRGNWTKIALDLAEALGEDPEDLFTEEQKTVRLQKNEAYIEMSRQQALTMADPVKHLEHRQLVADLMSRAKLNERERLILRLRTEEDLTYEEVGEAEGISTERARQIEQKALRKLRCASAPHNSGIDRYETLVFEGDRDL